MELQSIKTQNLQELIKEQIKDYIVNSNLKKGERLPTEKVFVEKLGISRTAVRESLKGLQAIGLIQAIQGKGYFTKDFNFEAILDNLPYVLEMHLNDFRDILEIRIVLETHYLTQLISVYRRDDVTSLKKILAELADKCNSDSNAKDIIDVHSRFHCELYKHSENNLLINLIKIFSTIQKNLTLLKRYSTRDPASFVEHHRKLIDAIERQDAEVARDRLISHFGEAIEWVKNNSETGKLII